MANQEQLNDLTLRVERLEQIVQETLNALRVNESLSTIKSLTQLQQALHITSENIAFTVNKARIDLAHKEMGFEVKEIEKEEINDLTIEALCNTDGKWTFCKAEDRTVVEHVGLERYCAARYGNDHNKALIYLNVFTEAKDG